MTRPAKQTFVPSGIDQAQFPAFFVRNDERNGVRLENRGDRELKPAEVWFTEDKCPSAKAAPRAISGQFGGTSAEIQCIAEKRSAAWLL
jgi:hypothetical protein